MALTKLITVAGIGEVQAYAKMFEPTPFEYYDENENKLYRIVLKMKVYTDNTKVFELTSMAKELVVGGLTLAEVTTDYFYNAYQLVKQTSDFIDWEDLQPNL